jgi:hypothetical protein
MIYESWKWKLMAKANNRKKAGILSERRQMLLQDRRIKQHVSKSMDLPSCPTLILLERSPGRSHSEVWFVGVLGFLPFWCIILDSVAEFHVRGANNRTVLRNWMLQWRSSAPTWLDGSSTALLFVNTRSSSLDIVSPDSFSEVLKEPSE